MVATEKIAQLDDKIASLGAMRQALEGLIDICDQPRRARQCSLVNSLQRPMEASR